VPHLLGLVSRQSDAYQPPRHGLVCRAVCEGLTTTEPVTEDGPHPRAELGAVAASSKLAWSPPAVPPTCPKQRFTAVANG
jgi:hypothetical protein